MSEVSPIRVYWHICEICGRVIMSVYRSQALWNTQQHYLGHNVFMSLEEIKLYEGVVGVGETVSQNSD